VDKLLESVQKVRRSVVDKVIESSVCDDIAHFAIWFNPGPFRTVFWIPPGSLVLVYSHGWNSDRDD